jgi:hypothetical protein
VDITLDQWGLEIGDDVTSFMEHALSSCNRVLVICTEEYVRKANTLKGGVGYERMIITAEIARDLKTHKFIPLIRNTVEETLPKFLGPRIYVDFRTGDFDQRQYEILLRALLGRPKYEKPPLGKSPYLGAGNTVPASGKNTPISSSPIIAPGASRPPAQSKVGGGDPWCCHWHRSVHRYCGYKLYLILIRFAAGSIIMKGSVVADLRAAGVTNYMIFHLYSQWDVLIRAWADDETATKLKSRLIENRDLHQQQQPEFLLVHEHAHFPDADTLPDAEKDVEGILGRAGLTGLQEAQDRGEQSEDFKRLQAAGLILDEKVCFDPERIQFYITIRSIDALGAANLDGLKVLVADWAKVRNRSIYATAGSSIRAVIKAQAGDYYEINRFLQDVTRVLGSGDVMTETMLVANREVGMGRRVDLSRAKRHVIEREMRRELPEIGPESALPLEESLMLMGRYVGVRDRLHDDRDGILVSLIRARASGSAEEVGKILSFFPAFEDKLRNRLVPVIVRLYGNEWQKAIDELKSSEGVQAKKREDFVLGDLCKIYKRIVLDKRIIDIAPLSKDEFSALMEATPVIRNDFAHRAPDLKRWESLFSYCSDFIPLFWRLLDAIEK